MTFILTIQDGRLTVVYDGQRGGRMWRVIRDKADYDQFFASKAAELGTAVEDLDVMCSSSIDFPHEYTRDPAVVALALEIRGGARAEG